MKPAYQTIALRLAYRPDEQQDLPSEWIWGRLLDSATDEVTANAELHMLTLCHAQSGFIELVKLFSSPELATAYLEQWVNHRIQGDSQFATAGPGVGQRERFDDFCTASRFMDAAWGIVAGLTPITIDPEFSEE